MPCNEVKNCPCLKTDCANHSKCCACVARHVENGVLPFCLRPKEGEEAKPPA